METKMTYEEIFHTMTGEEVRYSLDAHQEANRRLQISLDNAEKSYTRQHEEIKSLQTRLAEYAEANRRLLRMLQNEEVASQNAEEEIERLKAELA